MWLAFINLRQDANQDWKDASIFIQGYKLLYLASHHFFFNQIIIKHVPVEGEWGPVTKIENIKTELTKILRPTHFSV